ncbi:MAG: 30S ribosomal protein S20 [Chlamydiae bacterium]|nr:30S ribosomal protein S20 [Chlamydiota bacterium]MBI3277700.1 30S ribosomal protein S20 [Chlamydiota bacterium]
MAHSISAEKRNRQNQKKRLANRKIKADLKSMTKKFLSSIEAKKKEDSLKTFKILSSQFDRAAKKGVFHKNNASRHKSRLSQHLAKAFAA